MWWNFVARTTDEIVAAREDWQAGRRFGEVRAYAGAAPAGSGLPGASGAAQLMLARLSALLARTPQPS